MSDPTTESTEMFVMKKKGEIQANTSTSNHVAALDTHDATSRKRDASLISDVATSGANDIYHATETRQQTAPTSSSPPVHRSSESNTSTPEFRRQDRLALERLRDAKAAGSGSLMPISSVSGSLLSSASGALIPASSADNRFTKETARLKDVVEQTSPEAAQAVLREHWRKFLFGPSNDDHLSFLLRAGFKNASLKVVDRVCKEEGIFKEALLTTASKKQDVISKVLKNVSAQQLSNLVPQDILDQTLAQRLKSVPAKQLIIWLAEGDRLGYNLDDIINEEDESVIPNIPSRTQSQEGDIEMLDTPEPQVTKPNGTSLIASAYRDPLLVEQEKNRQAQLQTQVRQPSNHPLLCYRCNNHFNDLSGYNYHVAKKVCEKAPPDSGFKWYCPNCIQGFTTKQGMNYHQMKGVCKGQEWVNNTISPSQPPPPLPQSTSARTSPGTQLQQEAAATSAPYQQPVLPPPSRPTFTPRLRDSEPAIVSSYPQNGVDPGPSTIPRPPLYTPSLLTQTATPPNRARLADSDIRQSPSELSPERKIELDRQLEEAERKYQQQIADIPSSYSPTERANRLVSLKNGNASRKSQIRKSFGVSLRLREKDKAAMKASVKRPKQNFEQYRAPPLNNHPQISTPAPAYTAPPPPPTSGFSPINSGTATRIIPPPYVPGSSQSHRSSPLAKKNSSRSPEEIYGMNGNNSFAYSSDPNPNKRRRISDEGNSPHFPSNSIVPSQPVPGPRSAPPQGPQLSLMQVSVQNAAQRHPPKKIHVGQAQAKWEALQPRSNANGQMNGRRSEPVNGNGSEPISISSSESSPRVSEAPLPPMNRNGVKTTAGDEVRQSVEDHGADPQPNSALDSGSQG